MSISHSLRSFKSVVSVFTRIILVSEMSMCKLFDWLELSSAPTMLHCFNCILSLLYAISLIYPLVCVCVCRCNAFMFANAIIMRAALIHVGYFSVRCMFLSFSFAPILKCIQSSLKWKRKCTLVPYLLVWIMLMKRKSIIMRSLSVQMVILCTP